MNTVVNDQVTVYNVDDLEFLAGMLAISYCILNLPDYVGSDYDVSSYQFSKNQHFVNLQLRFPRDKFSIWLRKNEIYNCFVFNNHKFLDGIKYMAQILEDDPRNYIVSYIYDSFGNEYLSEGLVNDQAVLVQAVPDLYDTDLDALTDENQTQLFYKDE